MKAWVYLGSISTLAMVAAPAIAQGTTNPTPATAEAPPAQTAQDNGGVEDIIVTAQRRYESQQRVPISISTVTAAAAAKQGVTGTETLGIAIPSLQFSRQTGNGGVPFLRGVGSTAGTAGAESPVAVYVDDIYIGSPAATVFQFNNIDSIEVLKGPQGTLFGRNATGGVVHVHTRKPSHDTSVDATAGFGSYDTYSGSVYATGGLSDTVALNFSAAGQDQTNGYGRNLVTGKDTLKGWNYGFRSQLLWEPDAATSVLVTGDYSKSRGDQGQSVVLFPGTVGNGGGRNVTRFGTYDTPNDFSDVRNWGVSAKLTHDFDIFNLVSITAYRDTRNLQGLDTDASPTGAVITAVKVDSSVRNLSQEVQLVSPGDGAFKWIVGAFYYRSLVTVDPQFTYGSSQAALGGSRAIYPRQLLNSYAGFGEASYEFLPNTKLTVGLRYTTDDFDFRATEITGTGAIRPGTPASDNSSFSKLTYRAILDHQFTKDILGYASYSRGFKSGGYNVISPTLVGAGGVLFLAPVIRPEVIDAYEIGFKSDLLDHKVRINASGYHYNYSNLQVTSIQGIAAVTLNAASARINGVDIDANYVPNRYFSLSSGLAFLDSKFSSFPNGPLLVPNPASCTPTPRTTAARTGGSTTCFVDLTGNRTSRSPTFTMSVAATFTLPTDQGDFSLSTSLYHNSGYFWEPDNVISQPRYNLLNATLGWISPSRKYELRVYAKNLLNEFYYSYASRSGQRDSYSPEMPRNYGASLGVHF